MSPPPTRRVCFACLCTWPGSPLSGTKAGLWFLPFQGWKPRLKIKIKLIQIFFFFFWNVIFKEVKQFPPKPHYSVSELRLAFEGLSLPRFLSPPLRRRFRSLFPLFDNPNSNLDEKSCPFLNDFCLIEKPVKMTTEMLYTFPKMYKNKNEQRWYQTCSKSKGLIVSYFSLKTMSSQYVFNVILIFILVRSFIFSLLVILKQLLNAKSLDVGGRET